MDGDIDDRSVGDGVLGDHLPAVRVDDAHLALVVGGEQGELYGCGWDGQRPKGDGGDTAVPGYLAGGGAGFSVPKADAALSERDQFGAIGA